MSLLDRGQLQRRIAAEIELNADFRSRLLQDPRAVVGGLLDVAIPDSVTINIHEESLTDVHIVIAADSSELSDDDLEIAAGGAPDHSLCNCATCNPI